MKLICKFLIVIKNTLISIHFISYFLVLVNKNLKKKKEKYKIIEKKEENSNFLITFEYKKYILELLRCIKKRLR